MEDTAELSIVQGENSPSITTSRIVAMLSHCKIDPPSLEHLPPNLIQFMKSRGLDISELAVPIPRYIRFKPHHNVQLQTLCQQLKISDKEIVQIEQGFFALNPNVKISHTPLYQNGMLYGMDYSSAIPVRCLDLHQGFNVLELCSAPGNKSMLMADFYDNIKIKGVQISHNRANIMRNLIKKYKLDKKIQVIQADGLTFKSEELFDRVLVDAQCTHQGSLKHIFKFVQNTVEPAKEKEKQFTKQQLKQFKKNNTNPYTSNIQKSNEWSIADFQQRFLDTFKLANLKDLQRGLLNNGFSLLKPNGILVYSTCSFDQEQNEGIIAQFLNQNQDAQLIDAGKDLKCSVTWKQGSLKGTLRFCPSISCCGGMFIAKLKKL